MGKARKIIVPIVAALCVLIIVYLMFFFGKNAAPTDELTTNAQKEYTISFDSEELVYKNGVDFMQGVSALDEKGNDLTSFVTVSCKPTNDMSKKVLTYSINKAGYKISTFERDLILDSSYKGPSIEINQSSIEIPLDKIKNLSSEIAASDIVETNNGFGGACTVTAELQSKGEITLGDYVANVTAQNIFGDTVSAKITVTITKAESSIIKLSASSITIQRGERLDPMDYVLSAKDDEHGDLKYCVSAQPIDTSKAGIYTIEYKFEGIKELENEVAYLYVTVN